MKWLATIIILIVVCTSLAIFAPKNKAFFDRRIYPALEIISDNMHIQLIKDDLNSLNDSDFIEYPDKDMWKYNETSHYEMFPFYMFGKFSRENMSKCQDTFKIAQNIPYIRSMSFIKIRSKSVLKVHQSWGNISNETFRCFLGVNIPASDVNICGVWIEGDAKKLEENKWLVFDSSKKHSIYNKHKKDCYMLMFDLQRPGNSVGLSQKLLPKDVKNFCDQTFDPETEQDQDN